MVLPKYIIYIHSLWILLNKMCKYGYLVKNIKKIENDLDQLEHADLIKY